MAKSAKFSLKLLIDDKRNEIVLAEADQDFVDVLISLLTLPMGEIAKLLKNQKTMLRCFKNLNKSVEDMNINHFETEACKTMLLNPKSVNEIHCKKLKLNMSYTDDTSLFVCPNIINRRDSCSSKYTSFNTSICDCGSLMNAKIDVPDEVMGDNADGVFVNYRSTFIVTDDLKVTVSSMGVIIKVLNEKGYIGFTDLRETVLDVGYGEVVTLLGCLFTSETPLTSAFLGKKIMKKSNKMLSPPIEKASGVESSSSSLCSVNVFVRKWDREIVFVECNEDFIDSLLSFLVLPLELVYSLANDNTILRCLGNLCRSPCRKASASSFDQFPDFYNCKNTAPFKQIPHSSPVYKCLIPPNAYSFSSCTIVNKSGFLTSDCIVSLYAKDPKAKPGTSSDFDNCFMKRNTKFTVSNDLVIHPMKSASMIDLLKDSPFDMFYLEVHQITISKTELTSVLGASLISSSALNGLSKFLTKKIKEET